MDKIRPSMNLFFFNRRFFLSIHPDPDVFIRQIFILTSHRYSLIKVPFTLYVYRNSRASDTTLNEFRPCPHWAGILRHVSVLEKTLFTRV